MWIDRYMMKSWVALPISIPMLLVLTCCLIASYAWSSRPSPHVRTSEGGWRKVAGLAILAIPIGVLMGFALLLIPVAQPESLVLRSRALSENAVPKSVDCFTESFNALSNKLKGLSSCDGSTGALQSFADTDRILDAGSVAKIALDKFFSEASGTFTPQQIEKQTEPVRNALRRAVQTALQTPPDTVVSPPKSESPNPNRPNWVVEAIETAVVEGLTIQRNIRNVLIERHINEATTPETDQWKRLQAQLSKGTISNPPVVRLVRGVLQENTANPTIFGRPWFYRRADGSANLYMLVKRGVTSGDGTIVFAQTSTTGVVTSANVTCDSAGASAELSKCVPDFATTWESLTSRLIISKIDAIEATGTFQAGLSLPSGETIVVDAVPQRALEPLTISFKNSVEAPNTLECLIGSRGASQLSSYFRDNIMLEGQPDIELKSAERGAITVEVSSGEVWIYPTELSSAEIAAIKADFIDVPDPLKDVTAPSGWMRSLYLFPMMTRAEGLSPQTMLVESPLASLRSIPMTAFTQDPADNLLAPPSKWTGRTDARPVAFRYANENYPRTINRISGLSMQPIAWRIDLVRDKIKSSSTLREASQPVAVWLFSIDVLKQGMLLAPSCSISPPVLTKTAPFEPTYDSARFIPFWASVVTASRISASPDAGFAFKKASKPVIAQAIIDDGLRTQLRMRTAWLGMTIIVICLLAHVGVMLLFRWRSRVNRHAI